MNSAGCLAIGSKMICLVPKVGNKLKYRNVRQRVFVGEEHNKDKEFSDQGIAGLERESLTIVIRARPQ